MRTTFLILIAVLTLSCHQSRLPSDGTACPRERNLTGQPSWFPLGGEVYFENDADLVNGRTLAFTDETRWFHGDPRKVSKAEYDAYLKSINFHGLLLPDDRQDSDYYISTQPPFPNQIQDLPLTNDGVSVRLEASPGMEVGSLNFRLSLTSATRPLSREVEHRWTNALPFLFAICVDGEAVSLPGGSFSKEGGVSSFVDLVEQGGTKTWRFHVDTQSLLKLLPSTRPCDVAIVAAFSNRQQIAYSSDEKLLLLDDLIIFTNDPGYRPVLVRSNATFLRWTGERWESATH